MIVFFDKDLCRILLEEPILIPLSVFTQDLILDGCFVGLLIESIYLRLSFLDLIIEFLQLPRKPVLFIGQISDLLLNSLAFLTTHGL